MPLVFYYNLRGNVLSNGGRATSIGIRDDRDIERRGLAFGMKKRKQRGKRETGERARWCSHGRHALMMAKKEEK